MLRESLLTASVILFILCGAIAAVLIVRAEFHPRPGITPEETVDDPVNYTSRVADPDRLTDRGRHLLRMGFRFALAAIGWFVLAFMLSMRRT